MLVHSMIDAFSMFGADNAVGFLQLIKRKSLFKFEKAIMLKMLMLKSLIRIFRQRKSLSIQGRFLSKV